MRLCHGQKTLLISNASGSLECLQVKLQSDIVHVSLHRLESAFAIALALAFVWNYRWACSAQGSVRFFHVSTTYVVLFEGWVDRDFAPIAPDNHEIPHPQSCLAPS